VLGDIERATRNSFFCNHRGYTCEFRRARRDAHHLFGAVGACFVLFERWVALRPAFQNWREYPPRFFGLVGADGEPGIKVEGVGEYPTICGSVRRPDERPQSLGAESEQRVRVGSIELDAEPIRLEFKMYDVRLGLAPVWVGQIW